MASFRQCSYIRLFLAGFLFHSLNLIEVAKYKEAYHDLTKNDAVDPFILRIKITKNFYMDMTVIRRFKSLYVLFFRCQNQTHKKQYLFGCEVFFSFTYFNIYVLSCQFFCIYFMYTISFYHLFCIDLQYLY